MNIIIAGAGRVGYELARLLSLHHSVTVIDRNAKALQRLQESIDILPVEGDIEDPDTYKRFIDKESDLFIAVTDNDEANLLSTLIADDAIELSRKFIRLRNPNFAKTKVCDRLGIDEAFYPMELTSEAVAILLRYPHANNVKRFEYTDNVLISLRVTVDSSIDIPKSDNYIVVGVERDKSLFIPTDDMMLQQNDLVYLFGQEVAIRQKCKELDVLSPSEIERSIIFGADELGVSIAKALIKEDIEVKIIEKSLELCHIADEKLGGSAMTLSCKYGTATLFEEEGLSHANMAIAATEDDEYNIVKCLEAREHGIEKVMAVNNEIEYYNVMHSLGIVVIRGPKINALNAIIEKINSSHVITERKFCGGKGQIYLRRVFSTSHLVGKKLKLPKKIDDIIFILIRDGSLIRLESEPLFIEEGDIIVLFTTSNEANRVHEWIHGL